MLDNICCCSFREVKRCDSIIVLNHNDQVFHTKNHFRVDFFGRFRDFLLVTHYFIASKFYPLKNYLICLFSYVSKIGDLGIY